MVINQFAGSGGDAMPWYFRKAKRRAAGRHADLGRPRRDRRLPAADGRRQVTAPRWAIYGLDGQWEVEGHGIAPDVEVEQDPKLVREGHDPQLERAVQVALESARQEPAEDLQAAAVSGLPPPPAHVAAGRELTSCARG